MATLSARRRIWTFASAVIALLVLWMPNPFRSFETRSFTGPAESTTVLGILGYFEEKTKYESKRFEKAFDPTDYSDRSIVSDIYRGGYKLVEHDDKHTVLARKSQHSAKIQNFPMALTLLLSLVAVIVATRAAWPRGESAS